MLQKNLLILCLVLLSACASLGSLPPKPEGELCVIDLPRFQLICAKLNAAQRPSDIFQAQQFVIANPVRKIPLSESDKYISFSPDTWGNIESYLKKVEKLVENNCQ